MKRPDEEILIDLYWKRNENAIVETDRKYGAYIRKIINNILKLNSDVEECVNDTYLNIWNDIPTTIPIIFSAYIAKISRNLAINRYKSQKTLKRRIGQIDYVLEELAEIIPAVNNVEKTFDYNELVGYINEFLSNQPVEKRKIFVLRYFYSESIRDISKRTNFTESKIKSALFRIRNDLREYLNDKGVMV